MTGTTKRYRITSKVRFTTFMVIVMLLFAGIITTVLGFNNASSLTEIQYEQVQVDHGDTLWSIASEHMPSDMDVREAVYKICKTNDVTAETLCSGQVLMIPVYEN